MIVVSCRVLQRCTVLRCRRTPSKYDGDDDGAPVRIQYMYGLGRASVPLSRRVCLCSIPLSLSPYMGHACVCPLCSLGHVAPAVCMPIWVCATKRHALQHISPMAVRGPPGALPSSPGRAGVMRTHVTDDAAGSHTCSQLLSRNGGMQATRPAGRGARARRVPQPFMPTCGAAGMHRAHPVSRSSGFQRHPRARATVMHGGFPASSAHTQ